MVDTELLMERWQADGIECPPGVMSADIEVFERRHNVVLPPDMRTYFLKVNGMGEYGTCDDNFFSFWPLQELISIADRLPDRSSGFSDASRCFMFADHSVALPTFAIRLASDPNASTPVASVFSDFGAFKVQYFFDSFTDFVNHYLANPFETSLVLPDDV